MHISRWPAFHVRALWDIRSALHKRRLRKNTVHFHRPKIVAYRIIFGFGKFLGLESFSKTKKKAKTNRTSSRLFPQLDPWPILTQVAWPTTHFLPYCGTRKLLGLAADMWQVWTTRNSHGRSSALKLLPCSDSIVIKIASFCSDGRRNFYCSGTFGEKT